MRDSLNAGPLSRRGERSSRQKRPTPSEMPIAPGKKKDRGRARGASPPSQQRKLDPDDRPSSSSRKRPRVLTQMGGGSSRLQRPDPSISPPPSRKRGRPTNEERLRREKDCGRSTSQGRGRRGLSSSGSRSSSSLPRSNVSGTSDLTVVLSVPSRPAAVPATATTTNASTATTASVPRVAPVTATASSTSPSWPFMFQQQPQRQTRSRPVDQDRMMQVFIGDGPQSKGPRGGSSSNGGGSNHSANCSSSSSSNTSTSDLGEAVQTLEAFAHQNNRDTTQGGVASASNRGGARYGSGGTGGASRRHAGRRGAAGARARGASASPGRRGSSASAAVVATPTAAAAATAAAATATTGGESTGQAKMESMGSSDHVIVPKFRLHSLFISGDSIASEGGAQKGGMMRAGPGTGSRRKRPASGKAAAASGAESIAPPQPPRGGRDSGFLELTKNSLVRASHTAVFGSDYDLDDEDCAFLEKLNAISGDGAGSDGGGVESSSRSRPRLSRSAHNQGSGRGDGSGSEETGRTISEDLFEAMIEKLERQESRARDTMVLVEASLRLKQEHDDAAERVNQFIREGDAVLNVALGKAPVSEETEAGGACANSSSNSGGGHGGAGGGTGGGTGGGSFGSGGTTQGVANDGGANERRRVGGCGGSGNSDSAAARRRQNGYAQEDDSDSDEGEHQARILRSRGPAILSQPFALPLLRSCVVASHDRAGGSAAAKAARGGKGKGKATARAGAKGKDYGGMGISDETLLAVYRYWAKKRHAYGGPMLRCFHPFMMKLWRRMEDPVREAEDQEEGRDPHASPEAFDTLKSFRQDLDRARLVVDCVKRREKLKRSAIRFANAYWTILDETMDAPRPFRPFSQTKPPPPQPRAPSTAVATAAQEEALLSSAAVVMTGGGESAGRPSTRTASRAGVRGGGGRGGCRSSGRAAAAAARAAVAAIATAEALEDDEEFHRKVAGVEEVGGVETEREEGDAPEEAEQGGLRGARVNAGGGKPKGGCAEQEHLWSVFAQLPSAGPMESADGTAEQWKRQRMVERSEVERWKADCGARAAEYNGGLFVHRGGEEELEEIVGAAGGNKLGTTALFPWTHRARKEAEKIRAQLERKPEEKQQEEEEQQQQKQQQKQQQHQKKQHQQRHPASGRGERSARVAGPTPPPPSSSPSPPPPSSTTGSKAKTVREESGDERTKRRKRFNASSSAATAPPPLPPPPPRSPRRTEERERFRKRSSRRSLQSTSEKKEEEEEGGEEKEDGAKGEEEDEVTELIPTSTVLSTRRRNSSVSERRSVRSSRLVAAAATVLADIKPKPEPAPDPQPDGNRYTKRQRVKRASQPPSSPPPPLSGRAPSGLKRRRSEASMLLGATNKPGTKSISIMDFSSPMSSIANRCRSRACRADASTAPK